MKPLALGAVLFLAAFTPATIITIPGNPSEEANRQVPTVTVQIVVQGNAVQAVPDTVRVRPGQVVEWVSEAGNWEVRFHSPEPFGPGAQEQGIRGNQGQRNGQAVRARAQRGRYKYDIKVTLPGGREIQVDPEIIVDPGEGDGGGG